MLRIVRGSSNPFSRKGGGGMRVAVLMLCVVLLTQVQAAFAQDGASTEPTRTIVGDLLDVDRDFYIVRGERGEIQIEATHKTEVTEEFVFGDRIKAVVLMNNKALKIERAGPDDVPGVVEHEVVAAKTPATSEEEKNKAADSRPMQQPDRKMIVGDLLDVDRDFYIVRGERGEIQIEATHKTEVTEEFVFGDRIKAVVLMNNKALKIERAGPDDVPGVVVHEASSSGSAEQSEAKAPPATGDGGPQAADAPAVSQNDAPRTIEGQILMIDGNFYVLRGERGEIRVERTPQTEMAEEFKFGDFIKATVKPNDQALTIERLAP